MKVRIYVLTLLIYFVPALLLNSSEPNRVVLVTGGAGYIGSHVCKTLSDRGYYPVTYDSLKWGAEEAVKWGPLFVGDLLDAKALDDAFTMYKPCAVLHFAALRNVGESVSDPASYYTNNIVGSINLLNAIIKHKVKYLIFSSSCTVYGNCSICPIPEEYPKNPTNPYAKSKYIVENAVKDYADAYALKYMILRYFNVAGLENAAGLKRSIHSQNFLIPRTLLTLENVDDPLQVFGSDYSTPDGTCIRDYIHVRDLADAHVLALEHLQKTHESNEINLGTGKGYSVLEMIQKIEDVTGRKVIYELKPRRVGDMPEAVADVKKAKEVLGFEAYVSDLQSIIESEWMSLQKE